jgi:purine-cytosine permease-like protein
MANRLSHLLSKLDSLYEFDREPVVPAQYKPGVQFAGLLAGEHVAGTEFVIGAFFVLHGVSFPNLILGLLFGNLLAILSWTLVCAPIATRTRLTLYWYLQRIAGPGLTAVYNIANAILYCILAGAMIAVSATAIGLALGIPTPALTDVFPNSAGWVLLTFAIGLAFLVLAILGFEKLSKFGQACSPWIFAIFIVGALATLPGLGVRPDFGNFLEVAGSRIWTGVATGGQEQYGLAHVVFFAWFCNLAMHIGLSDMALFRYARHWSYGLYSAFGMYPGHMLAWVCSGIMLAGVNRQMDPGRMAFEAAGIAGCIAVVLASWTTANPTLYRAGLALQCVTRNWPRWKATLAVGLITTVLSCFPLVFMKLLDYVAIYGLVLMPVGAIVFAEHWLFPLIGIEQYQCAKRREVLNWKALIVWAGTLAVCAWLPVHLFFRWLPGYAVALAAYTLWNWIVSRRPAARAMRARKAA